MSDEQKDRGGGSGFLWFYLQGYVFAAMLTNAEGFSTLRVVLHGFLSWVYLLISLPELRDALRAWLGVS